MVEKLTSNIQNWQRIRFVIDEAMAKVGWHKLTNEQFHYLHNVLRLKSNAIVYPFDGVGNEFKAKFIQKEKHSAYIEIIGKSEYLATDAKLQIHIGQGTTSRSRLDYAVEKMTETGIASICAINNFGAKSNDKVGDVSQRWSRLVQAAASQCGRMILPKIHDSSAVATWLNNLPKDVNKILFSPSATEKLSTVVKTLNFKTDVAVLIGRRSGLTDFEEEYLIKELGFIPVSLGDRILRTETVGVVATSIILASVNEY